MLGELLRGVLLDDRQKNIVPMAELLLMAAARAQHIQEKIKPALESGKWVLCDRFNDSSIAYQGAGRARRFSSSETDGSCLREIHSRPYGYFST